MGQQNADVRRQIVANRPFTPSKADARRFCLALGIGALVMALLQLLYPRTNAPSGRWSWVTGPLYDVFGSHGLAAFFAVLGVFLLSIGLSKQGE
jgi:hypothetical protein